MGGRGSDANGSGLSETDIVHIQEYELQNQMIQNNSRIAIFGSISINLNKFVTNLP